MNIESRKEEVQESWIIWWRKLYDFVFDSWIWNFITPEGSLLDINKLSNYADSAIGWKLLEMYKIHWLSPEVWQTKHDIKHLLSWYWFTHKLETQLQAFQLWNDPKRFLKSPYWIPSIITRLFFFPKEYWWIITSYHHWKFYKNIQEFIESHTIEEILSMDFLSTRSLLLKNEEQKTGLSNKSFLGIREFNKKPIATISEEIWVLLKNWSWWKTYWEIPMNHWKTIFIMVPHNTVLLDIKLMRSVFSSVAKDKTRFLATWSLRSVKIPLSLLTWREAIFVEWGTVDKSVSYLNESEEHSLVMSLQPSVSKDTIKYTFEKIARLSDSNVVPIAFDYQNKSITIWNKFDKEISYKEQTDTFIKNHLPNF